MRAIRHVRDSQIDRFDEPAEAWAARRRGGTAASAALAPTHG
jgi:hypothetical protein